jgi:hypothetical protein
MAIRHVNSSYAYENGFREVLLSEQRCVTIILMRYMPLDRARLLEAVARRVVPEVAELDSHGMTRFFDIIDNLLADRPEPVRRQLAGFLGLIQWLPVLRFGRPFSDLYPSRQDAVLMWLQECPIGILQKGFWGLKTTIFMGYYGQPQIGEQIGYTPVQDGNSRLHD